MSEMFRGSFRFLSNFYPCKVRIGGREFPSSEHAYMSFKSDSQQWKDKCTETTITPGNIKKMSRKIDLVDNWDAIKLDVMEKVLREKFKNPELRLMLKQTGDLHLEESNWWGDTFWGVCNGKGENHLGKLLMKIRLEI